MIAERREVTDLSPMPRLASWPAAGRAGYAGSAWDAAVESDAIPGALPRHRKMAHRGALPLRRARALHEQDRAPFAVLTAVFAVSLLCMYVSAYARVTAEGFELSRLRTEMRQAAVAHETLQAEVSQLTLPATVRERAEALSMADNTPDSTVLVGGTAPAASAGGAAVVAAAAVAPVGR